MSDSSTASHSTTPLIATDEKEAHCATCKTNLRKNKLTPTSARILFEAHGDSDGNTYTDCNANQHANRHRDFNSDAYTESHANIVYRKMFTNAEAASDTRTAPVEFIGSDVAGL